MKNPIKDLIANDINMPEIYGTAPGQIEVDAASVLLPDNRNAIA